MGPILLGIILLCIHAWVAIPYPLDVVVLIAGVVALVYGLYVLFIGYRGPVTRGRRYWY
jgi:hypothetical protein